MQRVRSASVEVGAERIAAIDHGLVVLLGVGRDDRAEDGEALASKVAALRVFEDERGRMHRAILDGGGVVLAVPQFTLYGDIRQGRRPDFTAAAPPDMGQRLFDAFCGALRAAGPRVTSGRFGAAMRVRLDADGPVTIVVSTDGWAEGDIGRR